MSGGQQAQKDVKQREDRIGGTLSGSGFLSSLFLSEKQWLFSASYESKISEPVRPYEHFKMESLSLLKDILQPGDFMCKIDLKDAYVAVH